MKSMEGSSLIMEVWWQTNNLSIINYVIWDFHQLSSIVDTTLSY